MSVTLFLDPTAYTFSTLSTYQGKECICISTRDSQLKLSLLYVPLLKSMKSIFSWCKQFDHIPYTPVELTCEVSPLSEEEEFPLSSEIQFTPSYLITSISKWQNLSPKKGSPSLIREMFFDIEVEGDGAMFPIAPVNPVTCISYHISKEPTKVLTTLPLDQLKAFLTKKGQIMDSGYIYFKNQYDMIRYFLVQCLRVDRIFTYNGKTFDWDFLLRSIKYYSGTMSVLEELSSLSGRHISIQSDFVMTVVGRKEKFYLNIPGVEHVDLLYPVRRIFPYWANHKLDTCGKELTGVGKYNFSLDDYFTLLRAYKLNPVLSDESLFLLEETLKYSKMDTDILSTIYDVLTPYKMVAQEICRMSVQDWSDFSEAEATFTRMNDSSEEKDMSPKKSKLSLQVGYYPQVGVTALKKQFMSACNDNLRHFIDTAVTTNGIRLIDTTHILNQILMYSMNGDFNVSKYQELCDTHLKKYNYKVIGNYGVYYYIANLDTQEINVLYNYDLLLVPSTSSWICINKSESSDEKNPAFESKGKARICSPVCLRLEHVLTSEMLALSLGLQTGNSSHQRTQSLLYPGVRRNRAKINTVIFPESDIPVLDYIMTIHVNTSNYQDYKEYLSPEEIRYLTNGGEYVSVKLLAVSLGQNRSIIRIKSDTTVPEVTLDEIYYTDTLMSYLETLYKTLGLRDKVKSQTIIHV